jgi:exodeoxyribonuclease-3
VCRLEKQKPVVFCGDLNVSHQEIDLANPGPNRGNAGFTDEERAGFDRILAAGFIDTFREFETGGGHYTWWSNRAGVRERNIGWRIDYFLISKVLRPRLIAAGILAGVLGSDHCPITLDLA